MKKFIILFLCISIFCSFSMPTFAQSTEMEQSINRSVETLLDLGLIESCEAEANVTREMLMHTLTSLYSENTYDAYFERREMSQPILYGQLLMVLVDLTGYVAYMDVSGLDKENPSSYRSTAVTAGFKINSASGDKDPVTIKDYAELIYTALTDVNLLKVDLSGSGSRQYYIDKEATLMNSVLKLKSGKGVVTGTENVSYKGDRNGRKDCIAVDGVWYQNGVTRKDITEYIGMSVRFLYDAETDEVRSVVPDDEICSVFSVYSKDIISDKTDILKLTYFNEKQRTKSLAIDREADFIYNGRLLESFTKNDLMSEDGICRLIDNNGDRKIDVIIAEKYDVFMADTVIEDESIIIDANSRVYDLGDYLEDGGKIYRADGREITIDEISQYNIVSYLTSKDGEYTKFVVSSGKKTGIFSKMQEDYRYLYLSGEKYEALSVYYNNLSNYEKIVPGDEVEFFFDFKGFVADVKRIETTFKPGYVMKMLVNDDRDVIFKLLKETGEISFAMASERISVDGQRISEEELLSCPALFEEGVFKPQLILYKATSDGRIFTIDTALNKSAVGSTGNRSEFTLDYNWETESPLRILSFNGKKILGSKYIPNSFTKLFGVSTEEDECFVQNGLALSAGTGYKVNLYNVDENYVPEYAVVFISPQLGEWVDWSKTTYIVDNISMVLDEETGEMRYKMSYYDGSGNLKSSLICDGELRTPSGNSLSGDERLRRVFAKDLPRGTVFQFVEGKKGISSVSVQAMPMSDNSEKLFEKANSGTSYEYGISQYIFNGASICSYGKVISRVTDGVVVNNHVPTNVEEAGGFSFPMESWNRMYPLTASDRVWFLNKERNELKYASASEIVEGDMIFMHRKGGTITTAIVYR